MKYIIDIGCNSVVFGKESFGELCDFNVFVFDIQQVASTCISPLYACF